jgi:hypothetical protein
MYRPRMERLIRDLEDLEQSESEPTPYDHHDLAHTIIALYGEWGTKQLKGEIPSYKGIPQEAMTAGTFLGLNVYQIRELFLPHTIKKGWDEITHKELIRVLTHLLETGRVKWELVTPTHLKKGSLGEQNLSFDPRVLERQYQETD